MSTGIEWDDVVGRYPVVNKAGGAAEVGSAHVGYAENELGSRLAGHFTVPFSNNNVTARDLVIDLTYIRYAMTLKDGGKTAKVTREWVDERIDDLIAGTSAMVTTSGDIAYTSEGGTMYSTTQTYHPVFGMGESLEFVVSSSQIADEEDARE